METSIRFIDYHSKGCMEGGFSKIRTSGETVEKP
jgi:hypothetical protein